MNTPGLSSNNRVTWISLLLLITASQVHAETCFENGFGDIECSGLSNGARIGIGIAIFIAASIGLLGLAYWRRRRARNRNLVYLTNLNPNGAGTPQYPLQYPPQVYAEQPYAYNTYAAPYPGNTGYNTQFRPPPGSSPPVKN